MSLLTLVQDATGLLSLTQPSVVIGSTDLTHRQIFAIAVQACKDLNRKWWEAMTREHTFVTVAAAAQSNAMPADFDRFVPDTFFNRTQNRQIVGPVTPQNWQRIQSNGATSNIVIGFRKRDGAFLLTPTPAADETIAFEYISTKWARSADLSEDKLRWDADDDTSYFDEWLITLEIVWRWRKSKGLPYAEDYDTCKAYREALLGNDGGPGEINAAPSGDTSLGVTIPEGSWNA